MLDKAVSIATILFVIGFVLMATKLVPDVYVVVAAFIISMILCVISLIEGD